MNNSTKDKKTYESPQLTVVTFKTELGYAASGDLNILTLGLLSSGDYGDQNIENRTNGGNWGGTVGWF